MKTVFWICLAGALAVYLAMLLVTIPALSTMAGGLLPFDMRPAGYDLDAAQTYLAALGQDGRAYYLDVQHRLDLVFPGLMGAALVLGGLRVMRPPVVWIFIAVVVVAKTADYLENIAVARLLRADTVTADMVAEASRWTLVKSVGDSISLPVFLVFATIAVWRSFRLRQG